MKIKARNYLFVITTKKYHEQMICRECSKKLRIGEVTYSKRRQKYYCEECCIKKGHLTKNLIEKFLEKLVN